MQNDKYLILINKDNMYINNDDYNLIEYNSILGTILVEEKTLDAFLKLKDNMKSFNIEIDLDSGYRSIEYQEELLNRLKIEQGEDYVKKYVALPRYSEHHTGLAIDIAIIKDNLVLDELNPLYINNIKTIQDSLDRYGFILRYPKGKETITGYSYESWHFRYIDNVNLAKYIKDNNLTLEEYLDKNS